jgi:hypothetical protein
VETSSTGLSFARARTAIRARLALDTYPGALKALLPLDVALSWLAKRSYPAYRLWDTYGSATDPLFGAPEGPPTADPVLSELRSEGYASFGTPYTDAEIAATRAFILDWWRRAKTEAGHHPADEKTGEIRWREDGVLFEVMPRAGRTRFHFSVPSLRRVDLPGVIPRFATAPRCLELARSYFGTPNILTHLPYYMAEVMEPAEELESWHVDCVRRTIKIFLALEDITDDQAPLRFVPRSHLPTTSAATASASIGSA